MCRSRFLSGLVRKIWTKSYRTLCATDVEKVKKLTFHSVYVTDWCTPPGNPLSSVRLNVSKGPSVEITKVAPSLVEFLEAVTTKDLHYDGSKNMYEAFEVLNTALQVLTNPGGRYGLSWDLLKVLNDLLMNIKTYDEETVNATIVDHILLHLTKSCFVLNRGHSKFVSYPQRTYLPEVFSWDGLALGHRNAWYGELDMLVCPLMTGGPQPKVGVLLEKYHTESLDDACEEEENDDEEGISWLLPPYGSTAAEGKKHIAKNWSLFGRHFSQGFATAVTFSYVYHYKLSQETNSTSPSLLPTIQISPRGYQIYLYDCLQDVMLAYNFKWAKESLICLWAFLHHHLFFPGKLDCDVANCVNKFGYANKDSGFYVNRRELLFGESLRSELFETVEPKEGRLGLIEDEG